LSRPRRSRRACTAGIAPSAYIRSTIAARQRSPASSSACCGLVHRLPARDYEATRRYLWTREIDNDGVYEEAIRLVYLADGRTVWSLVYLADRTHRQFAGKLSLAQSLKLVRQGRGATGSNIDYLRNTVAHLRELGLPDRALEELARRATPTMGR
jgi:cation transport protein ChaC